MQALEDQYKIITHYCSIHGNIKTFSEHASGIAITPNMIDEYVPLMVRGSGEEANISTAYKMTDLAEMGVCKVDILKVKYTDIVYQCVQQLSKHKTMDIFRTTSKIPPEEQQHYRPLETADIPLDDEETFKSYCDMNLGGTFQTDTYGGYKVTARVQPKSIFDLMDIMTLNRPTSLQLKQIDIYMDGKKGIVNSDDLLQKYCVRTGGALLYQEQIMECCHDLGNMSWNTAYKVMKHLEALPSDHPLTIEFVTGAMSHGIEKERAEKLFRSLTSYTFNMGHSAAYAVLAYWGMWLKIHFPHLFFLELLKENIGNKNYKQMEGDAIYNKLPVFLAHVNGEQNYHLFPYHNRKCIRQGLLIIDHVGPNAARIIQEEKEAYGPFVSEENFMLRMDIPGKKKIITSRVVEALKQYGALNFLTDDYVERTQKYNSSLLSTAKYQKARAKKNVKE
jgi:DNA polymerase-3 subunit alpha